MQQRFDLIVVGAGMVGSALACALADSGLKLALLDAQSLQPVLGGIQIPAPSSIGLPGRH